jgi:hypothetical protein
MDTQGHHLFAERQCLHWRGHSYTSDHPQLQEETMSDKKVWCITGAGRGMGVDIAKAALAGGNAVVATARDPEAVTKSIGAAADLFAARNGWARSHSRPWRRACSPTAT